MNPYSNTTFFGFFVTLGRRALQWLPLDQWVIDEIQMAVLGLLGACAAVVGSWLVVRRVAMMANALSHTLLLGVVLAYMLLGTITFHTPAQILTLLGAALLAGLLTSIAVEWLARTVRLSEDSAIGLTVSGLFSIGVVALTLLTRDSHIGTEIVMGQVDALHADDVRQVSWIALINVALGLLLFRGYLVTSFDSALARSQGFSSAWFGRLLMAQTSLTCIAAFRAVGVVLVVGMLVVPPLTARLWTHRLLPMMGLSAAIGMGTAVVGVALARHCLTAYGIPLSTSGLVVALLAVSYVGSRLFLKIRLRHRVAYVADSPAR